MNWQDLIPFIPPTVAISVLAYLVSFFGRAVDDHVPYADNRKWSIELAGLWFFIDFLFPPAVIASALLLYFKDLIIDWFNAVSSVFAPISYHWVNLVAVFIIWILYSLASNALVQERYKIPSGIRDPNDSGEFEKKRKRRFDMVMKVNAVLLQPSVALLGIIMGIEILSGRIIWITVFAVQIFTALIVVAMNYSLMRRSFPIVNINFLNGKEALHDATLLKLNPDNIRVRDKKRVLVINRDNFSEIEFIDAKQETQRRYVTFVVWVPWLLALYSFWAHKLALGLVSGFVVPVLCFLAAVLIIGSSDEFRKSISTRKIRNLNDLTTYAESMPFWTKVASIGSLIGLVALVLGAIEAWNHNVFWLIVLGILIPFITWAFWQIVGVTDTMATDTPLTDE